MLLSLEMLMSGLGSRQHRASSLHVTPSLTNLIGGAEDIQRHHYLTSFGMKLIKDKGNVLKAMKQERGDSLKEFNSALIKFQDWNFEVLT